MQIDVLCNVGSVMGVTAFDIYGKGVGGAELALLSAMQALSLRGHTVTIFNNPRTGEALYDGLAHMNVESFDPKRESDALIIFRTPYERFLPDPAQAATKRLVWWPTDKDIADPVVRRLGTICHATVAISPFHADRLIDFTPRSKMVVIDCGVRLEDYAAKVKRVPGRLIYCSVPDRGLPHLLKAWPIIKAGIPGASLTITSDYRLWGLPPGAEKHADAWADQPDAEFLGAVPRKELCRLQQQAEIMAYSCMDEELFCIAAAECEVAGALPVTPDIGCMKTTNEFGIIVPGEPWSRGYLEGWAECIIRLLGAEHEFLERRRASMMAKARERFDMARVAERWEAVLDGRLP
jgi:glycosyltransferase involved in cell wall biosynthesis